jgi:hypothetical protein
MTDEEKYDRLLKKFQQDKDFDLMQEYGRFLMRHIEGLLKKATELAAKCRDAAFQHSYLIVTPEMSIWNSTRKEA